MAEYIHTDTGEKHKALDFVTTAREIVDTFPVSRGTLRMWMYKDQFEWVQIGRTIIIDRESFLDFYTKINPHWLDSVKQIK